MRNYIILNGKDSRYIDGLLVQELPPIAKPKIRTEVEEIDGRDGDIVTPLGYSAYDKELKIGLYGDYRIDDIISYFDSSGVVTFSNELDKYYRYQITDQIDFSRLVRFKTATVKFHVQPFKYSNVETKRSFKTEETKSVIIRNNGNCQSRPIFTIIGSGAILLKINGRPVLKIMMADDNSITIDVEKMEAYNGSVLKNRQVAGDYDNCVLNVGANEISWEGDVFGLTIKNYTRWI
ncbi:putative tail component [Lactobacillus phage Ld25A]|uniref:Putative tail component n=1 Tax=Lactobacillus phage Ld25A TaxID=1500734 RepID=A0A075KJA3_9CAUD|nr:putative tail component [Lactobacillus phage Ld25A]AIF54339.1 putative tail component [Lactobacillus phage Ld25A]